MHIGRTPVRLQGVSMNILFVTAGTGSVYAGSGLRDTSLALEWQRAGHHVTLVPLYTPVLSDEPGVSQRRVFFGGIFLRQHLPIARRTPAVFDRLWDSAAVIRAVSRRQSIADTHLRDEAIVDMLDVEQGAAAQRKELERLIAWLGTLPEPDVICLSSALLIGLARPLRQALGARVCCLVSDEDAAIDRLHEPHRNQALASIRKLASEVELFAACSRETATFMAAYFGIPPARIRTAPLGINTHDFDRALGLRAQEVSRRSRAAAAPNGIGAGAGSGSGSAGSSTPRPFTIGFLARIVPEKGLDRLIDAYRLLRHDRGMPAVRLEIAGALPAEHREWFTQLERRLHEWGYAGDYRYHGAVSRTAKVAFYAQLDAFSMPTTAREPKGLSVLEAMASGVPVVQPRRGASIEAIESTGGGLLVGPDDADCIAEGLWQLWQDADLRERCGDDGADEVRERFTAAQMADRLVDVFETARRGLATETPAVRAAGR
jgi:glycosyltransferase involved in cell wall biosynthesis